MPNIEVQDDLTSWMALRPELARGISAFSQAVYQHSIVPLAEREVARVVIARHNDCTLCRNTRHEQAAVEGVDESLYDHIEQWRTWEGYTDRQRLAAEFAERYCTDPAGLKYDADFWARYRAAFSDEEIVDLGMCCAQWIGNGRLMSVLDVAQSCQLTMPAPPG